MRGADPGNDPLMTATTPDATPEFREEPQSVDPAVGKYYRQMAAGWGPQLRTGWRAWVRRLAFWRSRP
jgi:hypothetical protein